MLFLDWLWLIFVLIIYHIFLPFHIPDSFWLDDSYCEFYLVRYLIVLYSYKYSWVLFCHIVSYLEKIWSYKVVRTVFGLELFCPTTRQNPPEYSSQCLVNWGVPFRLKVTRHIPGSLWAPAVAHLLLVHGSSSGLRQSSLMHAQISVLPGLDGGERSVALCGPLCPSSLLCSVLATLAFTDPQLRFLCCGLEILTRQWAGTFRDLTSSVSHLWRNHRPLLFSSSILEMIISYALSSLLVVSGMCVCVGNFGLYCSILASHLFTQAFIHRNA